MSLRLGIVLFKRFLVGNLVLMLEVRNFGNQYYLRVFEDINSNFAPCP